MAVLSDKSKQSRESAIPRHGSGCARLAPLGESGGEEILESLSADEGAFLVDPKGREANWLWIEP